MAEVLQVFTVARRILSPDSVPWQLVNLPSNLQMLKERYKFTEVVQGPTATEIAPIVGAAGEFAYSGSLRAIQQLIIEPQIVQLQTNTDDKGSDAFYADLLKWFSSIKGTEVVPVERKRTFQTIVIAKIDVCLNDLISEKMRHFIDEKVSSALSVEDADVDIQLQNLSWKVSYKPRTAEFVYLPKVFTIEPRNGTTPNERVFYTVSPADYSVHMKLLEDFERQFIPTATESASSMPASKKISAQHRVHRP